MTAILIAIAALLVALGTLALVYLGTRHIPVITPAPQKISYGKCECGRSGEMREGESVHRCHYCRLRNN